MKRKFIWTNKLLRNIFNIRDQIQRLSDNQSSLGVVYIVKGHTLLGGLRANLHRVKL